MTELAELFRRDLTRLMQELQAFSGEDALWQVPPGVSNSAGNLVLHLEGNLREYIGRQLGHVPYNRQRNLEFSQHGIPAADLMQRIAAVKELVPGIVAGLSPVQLASLYPEQVFGAPISTLQLLLSLYGHLNYHMGQIDSLRRSLTGGARIDFAGL